MRPRFQAAAASGGHRHRVFADGCRILEKDRIDEETGEQRWHAIVSARDANQSESRRYFQQAAH
jgi:uncharacterized DUF497 family protein